MKLITFARLLLWSGCIGSLAFFLFFVIIHYKVPVYAYIPANIPAFLGNGEAIKKFADEIKSISDIWQGVSAALVGLGAIIARGQHTVDKGLNGTWYWVSTIQENNTILRVAWGEMMIDDIHNEKKRKDHPQDVLNGKVQADSQDPAAANSQFSANEIVIGRPASRVFFYQWAYHDGVTVTGITKLNFHKDWVRRWILQRRVVTRMDGIFMSDSAADSGLIELYKSQDQAFGIYQGLASQLQHAA
jgi:hypothetical protein